MANLEPDHEHLNMRHRSPPTTGFLDFCMHTGCTRAPKIYAGVPGTDVAAGVCLICNDALPYWQIIQTIGMEEPVVTCAGCICSKRKVTHIIPNEEDGGEHTKKRRTEIGN